MVLRAMMAACALLVAAPSARAADQKIGPVKKWVYGLKPVQKVFQRPVVLKVREFGTPRAQGLANPQPGQIGSVDVKSMALKDSGSYQGTARLLYGVSMTATPIGGALYHHVIFTGPQASLGTFVKSVFKPAAVPVKVELDQNMNTMPIASSF